LWIGPGVPDRLLEIANGWNIPKTDQPNDASAWLGISQSYIPKTSSNGSNQTQSVWVYALVAPFPTVTDGVTLDELQNAWRSLPHDLFQDLPLLMSESTLAALTELWGEPGPGAVRIVPEDELLDTAWESLPSWGIIPFESVRPRWKVLTIDGQSPVRKDLVLNTYPLKINYLLITDESSPQLEFPASNYDPSKLTTIIVTGVTALTRATAQRMETKGITYPAEEVRDLLMQADITHVSNEVPFFSGCPYPDPHQEKEIFCSSTRYIELLTHIGTDIVELTGNHFGDYGPQAMLESLAIYNDHGIPYYGGGTDLADALKPVMLESNGNRFAFIGCNQPDVETFPTARESRPGAAPCDFDTLAEQIEELSSQGYFVFTTFQWSEGPTPEPYPAQVETFRRMVDAGALAVSGSQAHVPQYMEFYGDSFIHYGLGNLFFDQTAGSDSTRNEFIDRYIFYDGQFLGVELITAYLEDYSRPRFMTPSERARFLMQYFYGSGWLTLDAP
jgi:poly-gamma-glutamate synthesis protein (capsule biosynthesis protein)